MRPDVLAYVSHSVQDYKAKQATPAAKDSGTKQPPGGEMARVGRMSRARVDPDACGLNLRVEPGLTPIGAGSQGRQP